MHNNDVMLWLHEYMHSSDVITWEMTYFLSSLLRSDLACSSSAISFVDFVRSLGVDAYGMTGACDRHQQREQRRHLALTLFTMDFVR